MTLRIELNKNKTSNNFSFLLASSDIFYFLCTIEFLQFRGENLKHQWEKFKRQNKCYLSMTTHLKKKTFELDEKIKTKFYGGSSAAECLDNKLSHIYRSYKNTARLYLFLTI